jgi:murein DD-endopeptidase MepM/ murein hydrolase activator NlpD
MQRRILTYTGVGLLSVIVFSVPSVGAAQTASSTATDLQAQIDSHNAQIAGLDQEIAQYEQQLTVVSAKKQTLQTMLAQIDLTIKKTAASIKVTQNEISATQLQVTQLNTGIASKQASINDELAGLSEAMRRLELADNEPLVVAALSSDNVTAMWEDVSALETFQSALNSDVARLQQDKQVLSDSKNAAVTKKQQLLQQQQTLVTEQGSLNAQRQAENDLLAQTKSQESTYESIIAQKQAQEASLQQALSDLKAQYNVTVNPNSFPPTTPGILQWPIEGTIRITQYFGNTPFSQSHAPLYSGHGHDGLDIAAPIGTPVHAALSGTILATGNTDAVRGCYSFGKWVMIKHDNGLNTMYAHLSQISVIPGQTVATGDVIGYSGETGYATGPHLHFGVYVSAVTQIIPLGQATKGTSPCSRAVMPVPPVAGYLNPLNYLPSL